MPGRNGHRRVVFVGGWATHRHIGDDAILRVHLDALHELGLPIEPVILGADPEALESRFGERSVPGLERFLSDPSDQWLGRGPHLNAMQRLAAITDLRSGRMSALAHPHVRQLTRELENATALIVLGAGSLTSKFMPALWTQTATAELARALGVPVVVAGAMLGPVSNAPDAMVLRRLLRGAELVFARERVHSPALARRLGLETVLIDGDPAALMNPAAQSEPNNGAGPAHEPDYAVVCVGSECWREHSAAIDALFADLALPTIGIPMDFSPRDPDTDAFDLLRRELRHPEALRVLDPVPADPYVVGLIARARVALGSRYHLAVFAAAHRTPCVLVHFDVYSRQRAEGIADLAAPALRIAGADAGRDAVRQLALEHARSARPTQIARPSLPAIEWIAKRLHAPGRRPRKEATV